MDKLVVRSLSDEIIDAQAHWPAAPRLVISERPRLINLPLTTIHLNWVFISWPGLSLQLPVEQDDAGQDGEDAEGGDRGDREDDGEVDDDHQGADHQADDGEHVHNQPGDEVVSKLFISGKHYLIMNQMYLQFFIDP